MINLQDNIDDDLDFQICRILLQFEQHGAIINFEAYMLEDKGYLTSMLLKVPPFSDPVTLYELTPIANKNIRKIREDWINKFVPEHNLPNSEIPDLYNSEGADDHFWGLSRKRFNQERNKGRLGQAMSRAI